MCSREYILAEIFIIATRNFKFVKKKKVQSYKALELVYNFSEIQGNDHSTNFQTETDTYAKSLP